MTRWNSTYLMFERFLDIKEALLEMQNSQVYKDHHKSLNKIKARDWQLMANVVTVLKVEFYLISLERTGGPEEEGVRMFKDDLRESVLKKDSNRLGDFEDNEFYLVSTLCDPRFILFCKKYCCG